MGYLGIKAKEEVLDLSKLYLLTESRGMGIGAKAMQLVMERAEALSCSQLHVVVNRMNSAAIRFYENYGLKITKPLVHHFDNGHTEKDYLMEMELKR